MRREEMTPEWVRKEIEEVSSWGQFSISCDRKHYLSLLNAIKEARKEAEEMRERCCDQCGELRPGSFSWERTNPETPRGE